MNTLTIFLFFVENELCVTIEDVTSVSTMGLKVNCIYRLLQYDD